MLVQSRDVAIINKLTAIDFTIVPCDPFRTADAVSGLHFDAMFLFCTDKHPKRMFVEALKVGKPFVMLLPLTFFTSKSTFPLFGTFQYDVAILNPAPYFLDNGTLCRARDHMFLFVNTEAASARMVVCHTVAAGIDDIEDDSSTDSRLDGANDNYQEDGFVVNDDDDSDFEDI
jgi:hypothetical protein